MPFLLRAADVGFGFKQVGVVSKGAPVKLTTTVQLTAGRTSISAARVITALRLSLGTTNAQSISTSTTGGAFGGDTGVVSVGRGSPGRFWAI